MPPEVLRTNMSATLAEWNNGITLKHLRELVEKTKEWPSDLPVTYNGDTIYEMRVG